MPIVLAIPAAIGAYELALTAATAAAIYLKTPAGQQAIRQAVEGIGDAIGDLVGPSTTAPNTDSSTQPVPVTIPGTTTLCPYQTKKNQKKRCSEDGCREAQEQIDRQINSVRPVGETGGLKGLKQRYCCQKYGAIGPNDPRWRGEEIAIVSQQQGVRNNLAYVHRCQCPMPPNLYKDAAHYAAASPPQHIGYREGFPQYCMQNAMGGIEG